MNGPDKLVVELLSDTTFGRGEGTAGEVDVEVEHDALGLPCIRGKVLHGLMRDAWLSMCQHFSELAAAAHRVLGLEGELEESAVLRIGDAHLPETVRTWARYAVEREQHALSPSQVLATLTAIRRQTAQSRETGAPEETTLRSVRVVLRGTMFEAPLTWLMSAAADDVKVLSLCAFAVRHGGLGRHRGRGLLRVTLDGDLARTRRLVGLDGVTA